MAADVAPMSQTAPALADDGAARHLRRRLAMPDLALPSTSGRAVNFSSLAGRSIVYCYPWTGRPGLANPPGWDDLPGAHGSTPETEGFRNLYKAFTAIDIDIYGVSTQESEYQRETRERLKVPFELVSDARLELQKALGLPTFETGGVLYLKRLTILLRGGVIDRVVYPVQSPAAHARELLYALNARIR
jgi:peroxiredoxin